MQKVPCLLINKQHEFFSLYHERGITLWVLLTECVIQVWREDWCQHWTTICGCGAAEPHQLIQCLTQSVKSDLPAHSKHRANPHPSPPHRLSTSLALQVLLVNTWLNGGHISRLHSLWQCMLICVCAGRLFLSDSCTLSYPCQRQVVTVLWIIIIL